MGHLKGCKSRSLFVRDTSDQEDDRLVARFLGLEGKIHFQGRNIFVFMIRLKQIFLVTKNFGGELHPNAPHGYGPGIKHER